MNVSAKAVIIEVLSASLSIYSKALPVRLLVQAASVFGIAENSVRVAIVRLRAQGVLESPERGAYCLGPGARAISDQIHGWKSVSSRLSDWDGSWIAVFTADLTRTDRPALRRRLRALRYLGFEELRSGLFLRPNNLRPGICGVRHELVALGLEKEAPIFRLDSMADTEEDSARKLWDTPGLERTYGELQSEISGSLDRLESLPLAESVREAFLLGREGIRAIVLDPLLPGPLIDEDQRAAMVDAVRRYNDKGLQLWSRFLGLGWNGTREGTVNRLRAKP